MRYKKRFISRYVVNMCSSLAKENTAKDVFGFLREDFSSSEKADVIGHMSEN